MIAFGSQGYTNAGSNGVPKLSQAWNKKWAGKNRDWSVDSPDAVIIVHGVNDGANDVTADGLITVNGLLGSTPDSTKIILVRPFNGGHEAQLQAIQATCDDPTRVFYVSTAGILDNPNVERADFAHLFAFFATSRAAPMLAELLRPILYPVSSGSGGGNAPTIEQITTAVTGVFTSQGYTTSRAGFLDRLDAAITSRSSHAPLDVWNILTTNPGIAVNSLGKRVVDYLSSTAIASAAAAGVLLDTTKRLATNSSGQVQSSSLSGYTTPPTVGAIIEAIRTMDIVQRITAKLGLYGFNRAKVGSVTSDTARREDGGTTVFAGNETTKAVTITSNTPGTGTGGNNG